MTVSIEIDECFSKIDEFCVEIDGFCTKNDDFDGNVQGRSMISRTSSSHGWLLRTRASATRTTPLLTSPSRLGPARIGTAVSSRKLCTHTRMRIFNRK